MTTDASITDASARPSPQEFIDRGPMSRRQWLIVILGLLMMVAEGLDAVVAAFVYPGSRSSGVSVTARSPRR